MLPETPCRFPTMQLSSAQQLKLHSWARSRGQRQATRPGFPGEMLPESGKARKLKTGAISFEDTTVGKDRKKRERGGYGVFREGREEIVQEGKV